MAPLKRIPAALHAAKHVRFHAYKSVAPLKLEDGGARLRAQVMFPRLQKRGPIEAVACRGHPTRRPARFHAYKSVAPLKLQCDSVTRLGQLCFHAYKSVAPLKPWWPGYR